MKNGTLKQNGVHLEKHEYLTVKLLLSLGYDIELIPKSEIKGLQMPDLMLQGKPWEIKAPQGDSKNTIRHIMQKAGHQSSNVIIDLRRSKLNPNIALKEIYLHFTLSRRIRTMKVIINEEKIIDYTK